MTNKNEFQLLSAPNEESEDTIFLFTKKKEKSKREINTTTKLSDFMYLDDGSQISIIREVNNEKYYYTLPISELRKKAKDFDRHYLSSEERQEFNNFIFSPTYNKCTFPGCYKPAIESHNISKNILDKWTKVTSQIHKNINKREIFCDEYNIMANNINSNYGDNKYEGLKSGCKKAFCLHHDNQIFKHIDKIYSIEPFCIDEEKKEIFKDVDFNILYYKSIVFEYIDIYDDLYYILYDTILDKLNLEDTLYNTYKKILTYGDKNDSKDILFDKLIKSELRKDITQILENKDIDLNKITIPKVNNLGSLQEWINYQNNNAVSLIKENKFFMNKVNHDKLLDPFNSIYNPNIEHKMFSFDFLTNFLASGVHKVPKSYILDNMNSYIDGSLDYSDKDFEFITINILPKIGSDNANSKTKIIVSTILNDNWTRNDFEKILNDFESYEIVDWFILALKQKFNTLIINNDIRNSMNNKNFDKTQIRDLRFDLSGTEQNEIRDNIKQLKLHN